MSFRKISHELKQTIPTLKTFASSFPDSNHVEFHSLKETNPNLQDYGPVMKVNLENISSGESSPCHSDNEKSSRQSKRKKDLTLYNVLSNFLDGSTVEELKPLHPKCSDFDWVIIMGFLNDAQVARMKELLSATQCKSKVRYAKRVFYKGFRSCLFECKSFEEGKYLLEFALNDPGITTELRANLWGLQLRSKFKDSEFQSGYNGIILKNIPPQFTSETLRQIMAAECPRVVVKTIDVLTFIENTIATVITFSSLEEAELMCQKLNNKIVQHGYVLKVALVMKPEFKHRNKDNSIFKDYLIEPKKMMIEKMLNSRLFKENQNSSKKSNVMGLLDLLSKKTSIQNNELETQKPLDAKEIHKIEDPIAKVVTESTQTHPEKQASQPQSTNQPVQAKESTSKRKKKKKKNKAAKLKKLQMLQKQSSIPKGNNLKPKPEIKYQDNAFPIHSFPPYYREPHMMANNYYYGPPPSLYGNFPMGYFYPNFGYVGMPMGLGPVINPHDRRPLQQIPAPPKKSNEVGDSTIQKKIFLEKDKTLSIPAAPPSGKLSQKRV